MAARPHTAASTQVRLKEYGSELIEIADNGSGVEPASYQSMTLKYHTSKLQHFSDLQVSFQLMAQFCFLGGLSLSIRSGVEPVDLHLGRT